MESRHAVSAFRHASLHPVIPASSSRHSGAGRNPEGFCQFAQFWMPDPSSRTPIRDRHDERMACAGITIRDWYDERNDPSFPVFSPFFHKLPVSRFIFYMIQIRVGFQLSPVVISMIHRLLQPLQGLFFLVQKRIQATDIV